jgi:predicted S18 family serine protease
MLAAAGEAGGNIGAPVLQRERAIPILGVTLSSTGPVGVVTTVDVRFEERADRSGLMVQFVSGAGKLSPKAQTSVEQAIYRAARAARLSTDSWTVRLSVPGEVTLYGDSLSAMIGLSIIAFAKDEAILEGRVITGGISPDGRISPVGGVSLKIAAAKAAHLKRVVVPDEFNSSEADWQTPFLMHISPVGSIQQAYLALTGHSLRQITLTCTA